LINVRLSKLGMGVGKLFNLSRVGDWREEIFLRFVVDHSFRNKRCAAT